MAIDLGDEILQDFLVEAGEILEQLNEQLVDLEQTPEDMDLINTIFRGFHTIKGGGSFLSLTNLVEVCHKSEDVFNLLRNQELKLNSNMMDAFLRVLDEVNGMFEQIRGGEDPTEADPELLQQLLDMQNEDEEPEADDDDEIETEDEEDAEADDESSDEAPEQSADSRTATQASEEFVAGDDEITDDEFDSLLDALHGPGSAPKVAEEDKAALTGKDISDDEFESLLDDLHGKDSGPGDEKPTKKAAKTTKKVSKKKSAAKSKSDEITDDEFDQIMDDIHGKGKGPTTASKPAKAKQPAAKKPVVKADPEPVAKPAAAVVAKNPAKPATAKGETTVRVDTSRLDDIMNLVGELVLARNRLNTLRTTFEDERVHKAISNLDVVTADLQTAVMKTRMQPVKKVFGRFPRVVRDLARSLNKEVNLEMVGEDTDLDKNLVEALADPLVHLVRNSVDHGVETPEVRAAAGKDRMGTVILAAKQEGDHILLSITDDGAGMDPDVLRKKVVEKGLMDEETAARLDDKGCFDLIFMPGLSTKDQVSDVSGRGVGMDVVKTKITSLNGNVEIDSTLGKGTELRIKVPLTLAILPTLMVQLGSRKFALPLSNVNEIFELSSKKTSIVDGKEVVMNRGKAPPIFYLRKWLLEGEESINGYPKDPQVIMVQVANNSVGLVVDQVIGQEEVVIKPLGALLHGVPGIAGSTITGDGNIAIILDVQGMLKRYA